MQERESTITQAYPWITDTDTTTPATSPEAIDTNNEKTFALTIVFIVAIVTVCLTPILLSLRLP